jgi:hypothetical protein
MVVESCAAACNAILLEKQRLDSRPPTPDEKISETTAILAHREPVTGILAVCAAGKI